MNPLVAEWVAKAEGDYASALREVRARKSPNYDAACFHTQQCVEKYLKGILQSENIPFTKTHDLCLLLDACIQQPSVVESVPRRPRGNHGICCCIPIPRTQRRP